MTIVHCAAAAVGNGHLVVEGDQVTDREKVDVRLASGLASSQGTAR